MKPVDQKPDTILEKFYKSKRSIPDAYKFDNIDVDSYIPSQFLGPFHKKTNRVIQLIVGLANLY